MGHRCKLSFRGVPVAANFKGKAKGTWNHISEAAFEQEGEEFLKIKAILLWVPFKFLCDGNANSAEALFYVSAKQGGLLSQMKVGQGF